MSYENYAAKNVIISSGFRRKSQLAKDLCSFFISGDQFTFYWLPISIIIFAVHHAFIASRPNWLENNNNSYSALLLTGFSCGSQ